MSRRESLVALVCVAGGVAAAPPKPCPVCGNVGIVTIRTGRHATETILCPTGRECQYADSRAA